MKRFVFKYESILKMRSEKEDDIKNALAKRITELKMLENELERIKNEERAFYLEVGHRLEEGCRLEELRRYEHNKNWLKSEIENVLFHISNKEKEILKIRKELVEATKQKKIMEKLKEQDYEEYKKEEQIAEDKLTDQIVTYNSRTEQR